MKGDEPVITMKETIWRNVPGYEGLYQISIASPEGRCRSLNYYREGKVGEMTTNPTTRNRLYWGLTKNGKTVYHQAAKWIALTYPELIENEWFEGAEIDHKDGNSLNNHPSNLHWVTHKENMNNPNTRRLIDGKQTNLGRKPKEVIQYKIDEGVVARYASVKEAEKATGIPSEKIRRCCKMKTKNAYVWISMNNKE